MESDRAVPGSSVTIRLAVAWGDCDPAGIVFYPRFYAWMDQASHALVHELGVPREAMIPPAAAIVGFPVVEASAEFVAPARMDDVLEVHTSVTRVGRSSFGVRHAIYRLSPEGGLELLVRGREERVYVGRDAAGQMRPLELDASMRGVLARYAELSQPGDAPGA